MFVFFLNSLVAARRYVTAALVPGLMGKLVEVN